MYADARRQRLKAAAQFYDAKVQELTNSLKELEAIVQRKQANLRAVEEGKSLTVVVVELMLTYHS